MVLYHAVSSFQLIEMMLHKIKYNEEVQADIIMPELLYAKIKNKKFVNTIFKKIIIAELMPNIKSGDSFFTGYRKYYNKLFFSYGTNIEKYKAIFVACAHYSFGIYLTDYNIKFHFFEDANGIISREEILYNIESKYPLKRKKCVENGLYNGNNKNILSKWCNFDAQKEEFNLDSSYHHINILELLNEIDQATLQNLLSVYIEDIEKITTHYDVILLSQHFANLKILTFENQILIYQIFFDYFMKNKKVIIKPHPDDLMYYKYLFDCDVIKGKFISEFLPYLFAKKPNIISTISSTAIYPLKKEFETYIDLGVDYEKDFIYTHKYFCSLKIAKKVSDKLFLYKCNLNLVYYLNKFNNLDLDIVEIDNFEELIEYDCQNISILVDNVQFETNQERLYFIELINKVKNSAIIFVNRDNDYQLYDINQKDIIDNVIFKDIIKIQNRIDDFYDCTIKEKIYVFSKDKVIRKMIKDVQIKKDLPNVGETINMPKMDDKDFEIAKLKGILKATEARLSYYIEKEKEENK